jgi:Cdc6-like AAA superfamily ATPase
MEYYNIVVLNCPGEDLLQNTDLNEGISQAKDALNSSLLITIHSRQDTHTATEFKQKIDDCQMIVILYSLGFSSALNAAFKSKEFAQKHFRDELSQQQQIIFDLYDCLTNNKSKIFAIKYSSDVSNDLITRFYPDNTNGTLVVKDKNLWNTLAKELKKQITLANESKKTNKLITINRNITNFLDNDSLSKLLRNELPQENNIISKIINIIQPAFFDSLYAAIADTSHVVVVYGLSGCGKSFLVKQVIDKLDSLETETAIFNCESVDETQKITLALRRSSRIVIDNFHKLKEGEIKKSILAKAVEIMESNTQLSLTIIGDYTLEDYFKPYKDTHSDLFDDYLVDFSIYNKVSLSSAIDLLGEKIEVRFCDELKADIVQLSVDNIYVTIMLISQLLLLFKNEEQDRERSPIFPLCFDGEKIKYKDSCSIVDIIKLLEAHMDKYQKFFNQLLNDTKMTPETLMELYKQPRRGIIRFQKLMYQCNNEILRNQLRETINMLYIIKNERVIEEFNENLDYQSDKNRLLIRDVQALFYLNCNQLLQQFDGTLLN